MRALYDRDGGVGEIFSGKADDYNASRPDYPASLFDALRNTCNLSSGSFVADIGAGTGLLTKGLLQQGFRVVAVEPNASMRKVCDRLLHRFPGYRSVDGSAEKLPIEASSVDLITAGQAFHWFEIDKARLEFNRVLRPNGQVALIWNDRVFEDPLHRALDELFAQFGGTKRAALAAHEKRGDVPKFFGTTIPIEFTWPHEQSLNQAGLESLVFSRSYMPERDSSPGREISHRLERIYKDQARAGLVAVRYTTMVKIGRPQ
ncbi:MAG: class I SAM-dependent methyltransferase [Thermodesulfobacteriota bacterium]